MLAARFEQCLKLTLFTGHLNRQSRWFPNPDKKTCRKTIVTVSTGFYTGGDSRARTCDLTDVNRAL